MLRGILSVVLVGLIGGATAARGDDLPLIGETVVHFATPAEGVAILTADDDFTRSLSRFDLQVRLKNGGEVSLDQWRKFVAGEVLTWTPENERPVREALERLRLRLGKYRLPLPGRISLVHTSGREESNAAYTRGQAIILPEKVLAYAPTQLDRLLVHELFHVLSRNNPALRRDLYALIGFKLLPPLEMPADLVDRRITNPDAPLVDAYIEVKGDAGKFLGAPVLYSSAKQFDAEKKGSLFSYLTFRLLVIHQVGSAWQPLLTEAGQSVVIDPRKLPSYLDQIGRNTNYVIHPDEILADNFVHLVLEDKELNTPRIVDEMRRLMAK
ncbi:MAG: hypothetical protein SFU86_08880 [Pirellulaceae bacterium]|nr:hypothetical protein [Pirellulaceae bacterium]